VKRPGVDCSKATFTQDFDMKVALLQRRGAL